MIVLLAIYFSRTNSSTRMSSRRCRVRICKLKDLSSQGEEAVEVAKRTEAMLVEVTFGKEDREIE